MLYAIESSDDDFTIVSLGVAPGEWPIRAEQGYRMHRPHGVFKSIGLEGDLKHYDITREFIAANSRAPDCHLIEYKVVSHIDGFAYFPIVNPTVDWGAGIAAVSAQADDLSDHITMSEIARSDRINANGGAPLEFRTVDAVALDSLLAQAGAVDFLHCDIQGAEREVFPPHMAALSRSVRVCCIGTHGRTIETELLAAYEKSGWCLECAFECGAVDDNGQERLTRDGVFVWSNPLLR